MQRGSKSLEGERGGGWNSGLELKRFMVLEGEINFLGDDIQFWSQTNTSAGDENEGKIGSVIL